MLKRNLRAAQVHIHAQMQDFLSASKQIERTQQDWVSVSAKLNDSYLASKQRNQTLRASARKLGLLSEDGRGFSELSQDLKLQGIQCIDRIPQI